jgi:hypothetical protein
MKKASGESFARTNRKTAEDEEDRDMTLNRYQGLPWETQFYRVGPTRSHECAFEEKHPVRRVEMLKGHRISGRDVEWRVPA